MCRRAGRQGANTTPEIRAELVRQDRQERRRTLRWGIPAIVATLAFTLCAGYAFIRIARDGAGATARPAAALSAHCVLAYQTAEACRSTDPKVDLAAVWLSDASSCVFAFSIQWADGTPVQAATVPGGRSGQTVVASHTYAKPGTCAVVATNKVRTGGCQAVDGHYRTLTRCIHQGDTPICANWLGLHSSRVTS